MYPQSDKNKFYDPPQQARKQAADHDTFYSLDNDHYCTFMRPGEPNKSLLQGSGTYGSLSQKVFRPMLYTLKASTSCMVIADVTDGIAHAFANRSWKMIISGSFVKTAFSMMGDMMAETISERHKPQINIFT